MIWPRPTPAKLTFQCKSTINGSKKKHKKEEKMGEKRKTATRGRRVPFVIGDQPVLSTPRTPFALSLLTSEAMASFCSGTLEIVPKLYPYLVYNLQNIRSGTEPNAKGWIRVAVLVFTPR